MKSFPKPVSVKLSPYEKAKERKGVLTLKKLKELHRKIQEAVGPTRESDGTIWIPKYPKNKPVKKVLRKKRIKLPTTKSLTIKADRLFSIFVRTRDKRCVLCGSSINLTNGHLIKRGKRSVRWDELNCHCLCMGCNYKDNFDHDVYVVWFIKNYGALPYQDLVEKSRGIFKPSREFLNEIIKKYSV